MRPEGFALGACGRSRSRRLHGVVCCVLLLGSACAKAPRANDGAAPSLSAHSEVSAAAAMPTLPPPWELEPRLFDENGCAYISDTESVCPAPAITPTPTVRPDDWQSLLGFIGPRYVTPDGSGVQVLQDTISASGPSWHAVGLARNESAAPTGIQVVAGLFDASGKHLGDASSPVLIAAVRPGEPAPFELAAPDVPFADVAEVRWAASAIPIDAGAREERNFQILEFWRVPYGDREGQTFDPPFGPPFPFVLYGAVDPLTNTPVSDVLVVTAWVDERLRVAAVVTSHVGVVPNDKGASEGAPDTLPPRVQGDFYAVLSAPSVAVRASEGDLTPIFWALGMAAT